MKKIKISPSFLFLIFFALVSKNFILLINYISALFLHELAHLFVAKQKGYTLKIIKLSIFGLSVDLNENIDDRDQFAINIAGPAFNMFVCLICLATYWLLPASYYYLNTFCFVNLILAMFNLLPIYPLDGGKIFHGIVKSEKHFRIVNTMIKWLGLIIFILLFVASIKTKPNFMFLVLAAFFLTLNSKRIPTASIFKQSKHKNFDKVIILKVNDNQTLLDLIRKIKTSCFTIFYIEQNKTFIDENEIINYAINNSLTTKLKEVKIANILN